MNQYDINVIDTHNGEIVETAKNVRIPDRMRLNREYKGLEHDGRYKLEEIKRSFDSLGFPT